MIGRTAQIPERTCLIKIIDNIVVHVWLWRKNTHKYVNYGWKENWDLYKWRHNDPPERGTFKMFDFREASNDEIILHVL
jgi:hypothetical protein